MGFRKSTTAKLLAAAAVAISMSASAIAAGGSTVAPRGSTATVTFGLDQTLQGFNVNTSESNLFVMAEILNGIWPSAFIVTNTLALKPNLDIVASAPTSSVSGGVQKIVYKINPKARWMDGTRLSADDFVYNYQAESGNPVYKDKGGVAFDIAGATGYNQIASVKGSAPFATGTKCAGANCNNGLTVTVTFLKNQPFADWQSLFGGMVPAHIARNVGWNTGFNACNGSTGATVSSAEQFYISNCSGNTVTLSLNPMFQGTAAKVAHIVFLDAPDDDQGIADLTSHTTDIFQPQGVSQTYVLEAAAAGSAVKSKAFSALTFEHLDFNEANPILAKLDVRIAIAYCVNRAAVIADTVAAVNPGTKPLGNRLIMANQTGYVDGGKSYLTQNIPQAVHYMQLAGYHIGSDGIFQYDGSTGNTHDINFKFVHKPSAVRIVEAQLIEHELKNCGFQTTDDATVHWGGVLASALPGLVPTPAPNGPLVDKNGFDLIMFAWVGGAFLTGNNAVYCSYTNTACGSNYDNFKNPALDADLFNAAKATSHATEVALYNAADKILWTNMYTLPLYQYTDWVAWNPAVGNVLPNPSNAGLTWNYQLWTK